MCGIAGFWKQESFSDDQKNILNKMLKEIEHRGPDGQGMHLDQGNGLAMGHARLAIIDLFTGDQPLLSKDGGKVLTVNGEIYDYKRLRSDLMSRGARFQTKSDSEVILKLYERYGLEFTKYLRGEFAFALYDGQKQRLILVRDRFGIRPLFYHYNNGSFYYGSEIKALLQHPDITPQFDEQAVLHQLMQTMVLGTTIFKDIHAVKPGTMLLVDKKDGQFIIEEKIYWDAVFPKTEHVRPNYTEQEWIEKVREELIRAVTLRLEADVPVGCYLSGGIDSCSILGLATGAQQSPVKAYTISFDHDDYDEAKIAVEMAESMQADHVIMNLKAEDLYDKYFIRSLWHSERTFYNTLGVAKWHMSRRVKESGYKVVVTGEGSDELFGGYPFFKRDMILHGGQEQDFDLANSSVVSGSIMAEKEVEHSAFNKLMGFTPTWIQTWMLTLEMARPLLHERLREKLEDYDPIAAIAGQFDPNMLKDRHPLDQVQYTWIKTMLEGQILNWGGDRVDMANSMESRPPFLDHHLAELAFQVPPELRIKGNTEKYILREAVKGVLPEVLYKREKFAFMAPPAHTDSIKQNLLNKLMDKYLSHNRLEQAGIFDVERVEQFINDYKQDKDPTSLVRKDALINHILGIQILYGLFVAKDIKAEL